MKKSRFWISAAASVVVAAVLAGCGTTQYFAGRQLPPSKLLNRVMVVVQNPSALSKGEALILDAYYDIRFGYTGTPANFSISGFGVNLPYSIQNMPEEQRGGVYGEGDGSYTLVDYQAEKTSGTVSGLSGTSSSIFITRSLQYLFAANQTSHVLTIVNQGGATTTASTTGSGSNAPSVALGLPGIYRVSVNPGGSAALAFVQNSNNVYYPRQLTAAQTLAFATGPSSWPKAAVDCEPQSAPTWCLFQAQSPDAVDATGNYYGAPLVFDRPIKAVFSDDGSTAYILNCGPECGGTTASISILPVAPLIFNAGQPSGLLPCNSSPCANAATKPIGNFAVAGGASNALINSTTMYVVGQRPQTINGQTYFGGNLSVVNLSNNSVSAPVSISDGVAGGVSRMVLADDNTLWIGMTQCANGVRFITGASGGYGCLTVFNTASNKVTMIEPYYGDATGIAAVSGLHKIYTAEGGQVYIYKTTDGTAIDNEYVTVTGTAWDVAYMDATTDGDNTLY